MTYAGLHQDKEGIAARTVPVWMAVALAGLVASGSPSGAARMPQLVDRVTDFNRVIGPEEHDRMASALQEMFDRTGNDFYVVLIHETTEESALEIAKAHQESTVPKGFGGVLVCDFQGRELGFYLAPGSREAVGEDALRTIVDQNVDTVFGMPNVQHRTAKLALAIVNDVVQEQERQVALGKQRGRAAWLLTISVLTVVACLIVSAAVLLRQNAFGRAVSFPVEDSGIGRYGARYSGGHGAEMRFDEESPPAR